MPALPHGVFCALYGRIFTPTSYRLIQSVLDRCVDNLGHFPSGISLGDIYIYIYIYIYCMHMYTYNGQYLLYILHTPYLHYMLLHMYCTYVLYICTVHTYVCVPQGAVCLHVYMYVCTVCTYIGICTYIHIYILCIYSGTSCIKLPQWWKPLYKTTFMGPNKLCV